jgi:transcriptional regulator with XRE-family HTH domain
MSGLCRRCRKPPERLEPEFPPIFAPPPEPPPPVPGVTVQLACAARALRRGHRWTQLQLAERIGVPRSYVSKLESGKTNPTFSSLERLGRALGVSVAQLLSEQTAALGELLTDHFIAELIPYLSQLTPLQWESVRAQMRDMTLHPRRSA